MIFGGSKSMRPHLKSGIMSSPLVSANRFFQFNELVKNDSVILLSHHVDSKAVCTHWCLYYITAY